eukprot:scaffold1197_cov65-Phaeocystis_antarctica.AAC.7
MPTRELARVDEGDLALDEGDEAVLLVVEVSSGHAEHAVDVHTHEHPALGRLLRLRVLAVEDHVVAPLDDLGQRGGGASEVGVVVEQHLAIPKKRREVSALAHDAHDALVEARGSIDATLHVALLPADELLALRAVLLEAGRLARVELALAFLELPVSVDSCSALEGVLEVDHERRYLVEELGLDGPEDVERGRAHHLSKGLEEVAIHRATLDTPPRVELVEDQPVLLVLDLVRPQRVVDRVLLVIHLELLGGAPQRALRRHVVLALVLRHVGVEPVDGDALRVACVVDDKDGGVGDNRAVLHVDDDLACDEDLALVGAEGMERLPLDRLVLEHRVAEDLRVDLVGDRLHLVARRMNASVEPLTGRLTLSLGCIAYEAYLATSSSLSGLSNLGPIRPEFSSSLVFLANASFHRPCERPLDIVSA